MLNMGCYLLILSKQSSFTGARLCSAAPKLLLQDVPQIPDAAGEGEGARGGGVYTRTREPRSHLLIPSAINHPNEKLTDTLTR